MRKRSFNPKDWADVIAGIAIGTQILSKAFDTLHDFSHYPVHVERIVIMIAAAHRGSVY